MLMGGEEILLNQMGKHPIADYSLENLARNSSKANQTIIARTLPVTLLVYGHHPSHCPVLWKVSRV